MPICVNVEDIITQDGDATDCRTTDGIVNILCRHYNFARDYIGKLFVYYNGVYKPEGEDVIKQAYGILLSRLNLSNLWKSKIPLEVIEKLKFSRARAPYLPEILPKNEFLDLKYINVKNGMVDIKTKELLPHDPKYLDRFQLPVTYDPSMNHDNWDMFIKDVFPEDSQLVPWEILAWLMVPCTTIQKFILLYGTGSNGKSIFLEAVRAFLGEEYVSAVPLDQIEEDKFALAVLTDKKANICGDISNSKLKGTGKLKLITGFDKVIVEEKFRGSYSTVIPAKLIFSANQLPRCNDSSEGFYRRMLIIPMEKHFEDIPGNKRSLLAGLKNKYQLSGALNKALDALQGILKNNISESPSMKAIHTNYRKYTDPIAKWYKDEVKHTTGKWVSKSGLYAAYESHMKFEDSLPVSYVAFFLAITKIDPDLQTQRMRVDGRQVWGFKDLEV